MAQEEKTIVAPSLSPSEPQSISDAAASFETAFKDSEWYADATTRDDPPSIVVYVTDMKAAKFALPSTWNSFPVEVRTQD